MSDWDWSLSLIGSLILHAEHEVIDTVIAVEKGEDGTPIIKVSHYGAFWLKDRAAFIVLEGEERDFYVQVKSAFDGLTGASMAQAGKREISPFKAMRLLRAVYESQVRTLSEDHIAALASEAMG